MSSDFVNLPLQKLRNRRNFMTRLQRVERKTSARRSMQVSDLSHLSPEITGVTFWAIDPNTGTPRMVMSGEDLTEYIGVSAHFAGIDSNGVVQVYLNTEDGSFKFLAGNGTIGQNGIQVTTSVDQTNAVFKLVRTTAGSSFISSMFSTGDRGRIEAGDAASLSVIDFLTANIVRIGPTTAASISDYTIEFDTSAKQFRGGGLSTGSIADDGVYSFAPMASSGILIACAIAGGGVENILAFFSVSGSAVMTSFVLGSQTETTTGILTGTTGTDGKFTVSAHTNGRLYFENRRGGARTWRIHPLMIIS